MASLQESPALPPMQNFLTTLEIVPSRGLQLVVENLRSIHVRYRLTRVLGEGSFGKVHAASMRGARVERAAKYIRKGSSLQSGRSKDLKAEISILKAVDHPNLIKSYEVFENKTHAILMMELCNGGSLRGRLTRCGLPEVIAVTVMSQLLRGVRYLHLHHVCHRDLKPANVLLSGQGPLDRSTLKIADFGVSCFIKPGQILTQSAGTRLYMAPEVFLQSYDEVCDVWSLGVMLYEFIAGDRPFNGRDKEEIKEAVICGRYSLGASSWSTISSELKQLVKLMLRNDPHERLSASEALRTVDKMLPAHPKQAFGRKMIECLLQQMRDFRALSRFKQAAFRLAASMLPDERARSQKELFLRLDADKDGVISEEDLRLRIEPVMGDGFVARTRDVRVLNFAYTEFLAATLDLEHIDDEAWGAVYATFDREGAGRVALADLTGERGVLGLFSGAEFSRAAEDFKNWDCSVDFAEFLRMMRPQVPDAISRQRKSSVATVSTATPTPQATPASSTASSITRREAEKPVQVDDGLKIFFARKQKKKPTNLNMNRKRKVRTALHFGIVVTKR